MTCTGNLGVLVGGTYTDPKFGGKLKLIDVSADFGSVMVDITTPWGSSDFATISKGRSKSYTKDGKTYTINIKDIGYVPYLGCVYTACYTIVATPTPTPTPTPIPGETINITIAPKSHGKVELYSVLYWQSGMPGWANIPDKIPDKPTQFLVYWKSTTEGTVCGYINFKINGVNVSPIEGDGQCVAAMDRVKTVRFGVDKLPTDAQLNIKVCDTESCPPIVVVCRKGCIPGTFTYLTGIRIGDKCEEIHDSPECGYVAEFGSVWCQAYDSVTNAALNATIQVDGLTIVPKTPHLITNLIPGNHTVTFILEGYVTKTVTVTVKVGEAVNAYGSMVKTALPDVLGFDVKVNVPGLLPGMSLVLIHVVKVPFTNTWIPDPLSIPADVIQWNNVSNKLYKARQNKNNCDPAPIIFQGSPLSVGDHYVVEVTSPLDIVYYYVEQDILQVTDTITDISITKQTLPPGWMFKLCGWFDVTEANCIESFYNVIPDILFSAEDLSIIMEGKSIYPPYESKTPTGWNYAFVALTFIPGSGAVKGAGKAGAKAVKGAKLYPEIVQNFIKYDTWKSVRFPEKDIKFLDLMYDLQGKHLDEVVAKLEVGDVNGARVLITKYLPEGKSPDLCVKDLHSFTKTLFDKLPSGMPERLIKEAGLEHSFTTNLGKVIYKKGTPTQETLSAINDIVKRYPKAKELLIDDVNSVLKNTGSTSEQVTRVVNAADNYPPIIEDLGTKTPLAEVDDLIVNAVDKVTYRLTPRLTKSLFSKSLAKTLESPVPIALTGPQTTAIKNIIWRDTPGFIETMNSFDTPFKTKFIRSLALSGNEGLDVAYRAEGVLDASRHGDVFSAFGFDAQQVASAFSDYYLTMPEYWTKLGIKSIKLAADGRTLDSTPPFLARHLADAAKSKLSREVAEELVKRDLIRDSISQILVKGTVTKDEIRSLGELYAKYPISADKALKEMDPTKVARIINLLEKTKEGKFISEIWGIRDGLARLVDLDVADDALEFWIKQFDQVPVGADKLRSFISQYKRLILAGVILPAITIPLYYLIFEGSMTKKLGYSYGFLPTPIYQRLDNNHQLTFRVIDILKRDPKNAEGIRLAKEIIAEYNYLIDYVIANPIPEDPGALEQLNSFAGTGVGSLNEATLEFWRLERDAFIVEIEVLTGLVLTERFLPEEFTAEVKRIVDGDTVIIEYADVEYNVRFLGCNTPESKTYDRYSCIPGDHPFLVRRLAVVGGACGDEEIWNTNQQNYDNTVTWLGKSENLEGRSTATFKSDLDDQFDGYGRFLGLPFNKNGVNISLKSLREGQSAVFFYKQNKQIEPAEYLAAESIAKDANIGIWPFKTEKGWIKFTSDPTAAEVKLNGIYIGNTVSKVLRHEAAHGTHSYEINKVGYVSCSGTTSEVTTAHTYDNPLEIHCTLVSGTPTPTPTPTPLPKGKIHCKTLKPTGATLSGAKIYLTGPGYSNQYMGDTEKTLTVPLGTYSVRYTYPGYAECNKSGIVVRDGLISDATCVMTKEVTFPVTIKSIPSSAVITVDGMEVQSTNPVLRLSRILKGE